MTAAQFIGKVKKDLNKNLKYLNMKKQDPKEVASRQKSEMRYIAQVFYDKNGKHLTQTVLKEIMLKIGKNGKMNRSRSMIYAVLLDRGYKFVKPKRVRK